MSKDTSATVSLKNNVLIEPKRKKNCFPKRFPFPIVSDSSEETASWNCVIGHLKDHCVEVSDEKDIELLFMQGFFGKGSLSRSTPYALEKKFLPDKRNSSKSKNQTQKSQSEFLSLSVDNKDKGNESVDNSAKCPKNNEIEDVLSDKKGTSAAAAAESLTKGDSNSELDVVTLSPSKNIPKETLQLSLEEAYFLSYAFGALVVKDKQQPLDLMKLWNKFCEIHPNKNFPVMYTAYHHFRSKGWIVKSGLKYGCDFVLYKDGPPFYHSSYAVIVKSVKEKNFRDISEGGHPPLTWASLSAIHRICSHAAKAVMILYVIKPSSISENKISTPYCVSQYLLEEVIVNRWVPSQEQRPGCSSLKEK